ncbi:MAG: pentapeptide repeat-containing protein, partial [Myxococcota bacterium]
GADFSEARLSGTRFGLATLEDTDFAFAQSICSWGGSVPDPNCASFVGASLTGADFGWAHLDGAVFSQVNGDCVGDVCTLFPSAWLRGSDFSQASLDGANFNGASLGQANLAGASFEDAIFVLALLDGATAVCTEPPCGVDMDRANLELASLVDVDFDSASLVGSRLTNATLTRATLTRAQLTSADLNAALLSGIRLSGSDLSDAVLRAAEGGCVAPPVGSGDTDPWCPEFAGASLIRADLSFAQINGAVMTTADLSEAVLVDALFDGLSDPCTVPSEEGEGYTCMIVSPPGAGQGTDMTGLVSRSSDWAGVDLSGARLPGANLSSTLFSVVRTIEPEGAPSFEETYVANLSGADLTQAVLSQSDLTGVNLIGALLAQADLSGATLVDVVMDATTVLTGADFTTSALSGADLRGAVFDEAEFAEGASVDEADCTLPDGGSAVDLVGAKLAGANFSTSAEFLRGCISVDQTTTYSLETGFPPFFDLQSEMTLVPAPRAIWLQATMLGLVARLRARSRRPIRRAGGAGGSDRAA